MVQSELMIDYASGALPEPVALAMATHISLSPAARDAYAQLNALGGMMLEALDDDGALSDDALDDVLQRLDAPEPVAPSVPDLDDRTRAIVPGPLQRYLPASLDSLPWKQVIRGVKEYRFETTVDGYKTALIRVAPGRPMPRHSHRGPEYTVILDGAYDDDDGMRLERGDICEAQPADNHQPVADPETGCICLIVLDAPLKLSGFLGTVINPFLKT